MGQSGSCFVGQIDWHLDKVWWEVNCGHMGSVLLSSGGVVEVFLPELTLLCPGVVCYRP